MDGVDIERTERSDQEEQVSDRFLKELHSEWRLTRCLQIFQEKWGGEMESGFTLGKWGKGQESRWRDWTFSHEELGGNCGGLPMLFQPRASTGCTSLRGEDTGLMLTSSSQGCSQHTERPCGSCHPFFAELPQDRVCRHLTKEGQTRNDISENEIPRVFESCHPMRNSISLAKLIELIYLEFWKDILWLLVLKISYKNIIFFALQLFITKLIPTTLRCTIFDVPKSSHHTTRVSWHVLHLLKSCKAKSGSSAALSQALILGRTFPCFQKKFWNHNETKV